MIKSKDLWWKKEPNSPESVKTKSDGSDNENEEQESAVKKRAKVARAYWNGPRGHREHRGWGYSKGSTV